MEIEVNGIRLFYTQKGSGAPIILLHGNGESQEIFEDLAERLAPRFSVYAIDSRGHGQSERTKELSYAAMAEDTIEFIERLALERPTVYGFSDGGIVALMIAIKKPGLLGSLICSGANVSPAGLRGGFRLFCRSYWFFTRSPLFKMMLDEPNISAEELESIAEPTVILAGQRDLIKEEHSRYIARHIHGARLEILPGESHQSYVLDNGKLYAILEKYL